jgi:hypothetical protein
MSKLLESRGLLGSLVGKKLSRVQRQLFLNDYAFYTAETRDQESDGPTEFRTVDGTEFHFLGNTEQQSIEIFSGPSPRYGESFANKDITLNTFWSSRINKSIISMDVLQSIYGVEGALSAFGVEFFFDGAESFVMEYLSDETHQDQVRITGPYKGPPCLRIAVAQKDGGQ